jgi:hypothetical protein
MSSLPIGSRVVDEERARTAGSGAAIPGGVAEQAEAAAESNATAAHGEDKVTIGDVLKVRTHTRPLRKHVCACRVRLVIS